jgi:hypothetical protein
MVGFVDDRIILRNWWPGGGDYIAFSWLDYPSGTDVLIVEAARSH